MGVKTVGAVVAAILAVLGFRGTWAPPLATVAALAEAASPGPLDPRAPRGASCGGVTAHADLGDRCESCHAPAFARASDDMSSRCVHCHQQIDRQASGVCSGCHGEHAGPAPYLAHPRLGPDGRFHQVR